MVLTSEASAVWKFLNGIICVFKPAGFDSYLVRKAIISNVCRDLNQLECRPPINYVAIEGNPEKRLSINVRQSFADNPLVVGPRYQPQDVRCNWAAHLGKHTSGVLLLGINGGVSEAQRLNESRPTRAYHLKGRFGQATENAHIDGRVVEKAKFDHVKRLSLDRVAASLQAAHQKQMFEQSGVDIQSQAAYELASKGPLRPSNNKIPLLYGIKCIAFNSPDFVIEVQSVNETEDYLKMLIHEIGIQLHTVATCAGLQCIRHGNFTVDQALLRKHWTLGNIVANLSTCRELARQLKFPPAQLATPQRSTAEINTR